MLVSRSDDSGRPSDGPWWYECWVNPDTRLALRVNRTPWPSPYAGRRAWSRPGVQCLSGDRQRLERVLLIEPNEERFQLARDPVSFGARVAVDRLSLAKKI
jgi:hypothetical protein